MKVKAGVTATVGRVGVGINASCWVACCSNREGREAVGSSSQATLNVNVFQADHVLKIFFRFPPYFYVQEWNFDNQMCYIIHLLAVSVMQDSECKSRDFNKRQLTEVQGGWRKPKRSVAAPRQYQLKKSNSWLRARKKEPTVFPEFIRARGMDKGISTRSVVQKGWSHCQKSWSTVGKNGEVGNYPNSLSLLSILWPLMGICQIKTEASC